MTIGEIIETYQREHNMSERAFAKACGLSHTQVNSLKKGKTSNGKKFSPSVDTIRKVAEAMGMTPQEILSNAQDLTFGSGEPDMFIPAEKMELINLIGMIADRPEVTLLVDDATLTEFQQV